MIKTQCFTLGARLWRITCNKKKVMVSKDTIKQLVLRQLGNTKLIDNIPGMPADIVSMGSSQYKKSEAELTKNEKLANFISMSELLTKMEAWAATDLDGLILPRSSDEPT